MKSSFKTAAELIKTYNWNSIFYRYWKKIMLVIMVPFLIINATVFFYYNNLTVNDTVRATTYDFLQLSNSLDKFFDKVQESNTLLSANSKMHKFITYPDITKINTQTSNTINDVLEIMSTLKLSIEYISAIQVYSFTNNYVLSTSGGNFINEYVDTPWYQYHQKNPNTDFIIGNDDTNNGTITLCYTIKSASTPLGLLIFELNTQYIKDILRNDEYSYYNIQILDNSGKSLFQTNTENFNFPEIKEMKLEAGRELRLSKNKDTLYISSNVGTVNTLALTAKLNTLKNNSNKILIVFVICLLIAILSPLALSFYISLQFYNSIQDIIINFYKFETPQNSSDVNNNELEFISKNIINMRDKNIILEKELTKKISELKKLQSAALQMQFSPHFLFNTLNAISVVIMSITTGNNPASKAICLLSELLTIALNTNEYIVTIEQEILYAKKYVEIEKFKNKDNFDTIWNIDENILNFKTPKLILQPIIENAFKHGIKYLRNASQGILKISAYEKDEDIIFTVCDNGPGIEKERLVHLQNSLNNNDMPDPKHIGLCNVNSRIKLIFSENYGISINSEKNNTVVTIKIPKN
jgi:two-component system sensor histidine kinase YesM